MGPKPGAPPGPKPASRQGGGGWRAFLHVEYQGVKADFKVAAERYRNLSAAELARYVEPPELPTFAMHKVFGTFLLEAFSYMRNV